MPLLRRALALCSILACARAPAVRPFRAVWIDGWASACDAKGFPPRRLPPFGALGFEVNDANGSRTGNSGGILYSTSSALPYPYRESGLVPFYEVPARCLPDDANCSAAKPINGGLPQALDLTAHVAALTRDIERQIPDPEASGVYSFDWEFWWPVWERNGIGGPPGQPPPTSIYQNRSIMLVQQRHPDWDQQQLVAQAKREWEAAARALFLATLRTAKALRPNSLWGFYNYPNCDGPANGLPGVAPCSCTASQNDELEWLWDEVTALQPSIYVLWDHPENSTRNAFYVDCQMAEANRVVAKRKARGPAGELPVFAFVWPRYHSNHFDGHYAPDARTYLRGADMVAEFGRPALLHGAAGVLIWGMKDDVINDTQCNGPSSFGRWVNMSLGPYDSLYN